MAWCKSCKRSFKGEAALGQHIKNSPAHSSKSEEIQDSPAHARSYDCKSCNRSFNNEVALKKHIQYSPAHGRLHDERWSMYPTNHESVSTLLEEDGLYFDFHDVDNAAGCDKAYDTNIMGRFPCHNKRCHSKGWSSKKIAITIRLYPGKKYNARVYHQRCQSCNNLSRPLLDESYADRVAYRIKKWRGIHMDLPSYSAKSNGPHYSHLCEGCRDGHCSQLSGKEYA
ncbi:hypothetical protein EMCG_01051 [[Emmonsia] crescens]|uniref:C2H2-type domain-containing protein n=1 Tax=[Emmonsia] crescens TaxID=73230 RepID=A0A0G2JC47_9EURO|nr:hypothetical protein EMCG_01051 [Emmonsia crescens UAMH 3008]